MNTVIVIPARLSSSRLADKLILDLNGRTVLQHVYDNLKMMEHIHGIYIATDSEVISSLASSFGAEVIMTAETHKSGTDRIAEAVKNLDCEYVINVQGDEPLIQVKHLVPMLEAFTNNPAAEIFTLYEKLDNRKILNNLTDVKLVTDMNGYALYFSRLPIPFRDLSAGDQFKKHVGVYGFKKETLMRISQLEQTELERMERLEQLRWLENGFRIKAVEVESGLYSIDTQEDYEEVRRLMEDRQDEPYL